ncbi:hypothetical protein AX17_002442 [Amanita inopinata Kibby_2008]|nr:hypothetical protein AX17_002442 [Amanita inopinata Kibby_2008]
MPVHRTQATRTHRKKAMGALLGKPERDDHDGPQYLENEGTYRRRSGRTINKVLPSVPSGISPDGEPLHPPQKETALSAKIKDLEDTLEEVQRSKGILQQEFRAALRELEDAKRETSAVKQELESNRVFASKADAVSDADIVAKLEALNNSVYQTASVIADALEASSFRFSSNSPSEHTASYFGDPLIRLAGNVRSRPTFTAALNSLQACINHFCISILLSEFSSIVAPKETQLLQRIFDNMRASETRVVAARWRSLAHLHSQGSIHNQQQLCRFLIRRLTNVFGLPTERFESDHGEDLSNIVNLTLDLLKMICRDYVSADVSVFCPLPGDTFDSTTMELADSKGDDGFQIDGCIACTTDIGLRRTSLFRRRNSEDGWVDEQEMVILTKAKVVISFEEPEDG